MTSFLSAFSCRYMRMTNQHPFNPDEGLRKEKTGAREGDRPVGLPGGRSGIQLRSPRHTSRREEGARSPGSTAMLGGRAHAAASSDQRRSISPAWMPRRWHSRISETAAFEGRDFLARHLSWTNFVGRFPHASVMTSKAASEPPSLSKMGNAIPNR